MSNQNLFAKHLTSLHTDGISWKAKNLWATATDPDIQATAIEEMTTMMLCVGNEVKRTGYIEVVQKDLKIKNQLLKKAVKDEVKRIEARNQAAIIKKKLEAQYTNAQDAGLQDGFDGNIYDALKFGIYEHEGVYYTRGNKGGDYPVSNFTMKILYHIPTADGTAFRMMSIKNVYGFDKMIMMNTDDFVSLGSFKKIIARFGDYVFKGTDSDLSRLQEFLQRGEMSTQYVKTLGWNKRAGFYAFANGIIIPGDEGVTFTPIDEYGIVGNGNKTFVIPALSEMYREKDEQYVNEKKFIYATPQPDFGFKEWSKLFSTAYGDKGIVAILFYIGSLFRDIIMKQAQRYPLLNLFGPPGAGKGQVAESLMAMFGEGQNQIMLGGASTPVGFMRKFAQFSNALVWLDEYKNNLPIKFIESFKNIYDGKGYERGKMTNDFATESTPIYSSCILSGQDMPTQEPALFMRCIMASFKEGKFTEAQRKAYVELKDREQTGLSYITAELVSYRGRVEENFKDQQAIIFKQLIKEVANVEVDDRMYLNISLLLTIHYIFKDLLPFAFTYEQAKTWLINNMMQQHQILAGNNDVAKFWQTVEAMYHQGLVVLGRDFEIKDRYMYIRLQQVQPTYQKELLQRRDMNFLSKNTLEHYFSLDNTIYVEHKKVRFSDGSNTGACIFKYEALCEKFDIDFSKTMGPMPQQGEWKAMDTEAPL